MNQTQHWTRNWPCSPQDHRCTRRRQIPQKHRSSKRQGRCNLSKLHIHTIRHLERHRSHNCMHWDTCSLLLCCSLKASRKRPKIGMGSVCSCSKFRYRSGIFKSFFPSQISSQSIHQQLLFVILVVVVYDLGGEAMQIRFEAGDVIV